MNIAPKRNYLIRKFKLIVSGINIPAISLSGVILIIIIITIQIIKSKTAL